MLSKIIDFSIFSVIFFSAIIFFKEPFEMQLSYIPLIFLLFIFLFKYKFPTQVGILFFLLLLFGVFNIYYGNDTTSQFIKIYANILVGVLFFYYVFEYYERDVEKFFGMYMQWSFVAAAIGIFQLVSFWVGFRLGYDYTLIGFNKWGLTAGGLGIRVNGIFCEPSYVGATLGPAFFISMYNLIFNKTFFINKLMCITIIATYLLSTSSVAYIGVFITILLLLLNYGVIRYFVFVVPIVFVMAYYLYSNVTEFRVRADGLYALYFDDIIEREGIDISKGGSVYQQAQMNYLLTKIHGSSFVQYNNFFITKQNFMENPFFGTGLGSHEIAFKKYDLSAKIGNIYDSNQADANSMLLRIISETGLFGLIFIILFIKNSYVKRRGDDETNDIHWLISNAVLVIILLQLARQGNYTFGGFMAFMWLYYYTKQDYLIKEENQPKEINEELENELESDKTLKLTS